MAEVIEVDLALIEEPTHILRPVDKSSVKYQGLLKSMAQHGWSAAHPVEVCRNPGGTYVLQRDGMHRFYAASELRLQKAWVAVLDKPLSDAELISGQIRFEATHTDARPAEFGRAVRKYMDLPENKGKTKVEIASEVGRETGFLDKILNLASLPEAVQELVDDGEIKLGNGLVLAHLAKNKVELTKEILDKAKVEDVASFTSYGSAKIQELRAGPRLPKVAPPRLRKVEDVRGTLDRARKDPTVHPEYVRALAYCLRQDAVSAAAEGAAPVLTGAEAEGAALRAQAAQAQAALEAANVLREAAEAKATSLARENERLNQIIDQKESVIRALEKGRKPEA